MLVSAHTSAGKTVVAQYAIAMAIQSNQVQFHRPQPQKLAKCLPCELSSAVILPLVQGPARTIRGLYRLSSILTNPSS